MWQDFHSDPRISYYLFLRRTCLYSAADAHRQLKRIDAMVVGLLPPPQKQSWSERLGDVVIELMSRARHGLY